MKYLGISFIAIVFITSLATNIYADNTQINAAAAAKIEAATKETDILSNEIKKVTLNPEVREPTIITEAAPVKTGYLVGVDDILDIVIIQPEPLPGVYTVSVDGTISFPYIGNVEVRGKTLDEIKAEIETRLSEGYLKYPVVSVALKQSLSNKFFVYGEVMKPGTFLADDKTTVLKAISMAGGFTKFGSTTVKVLRPKKNGSGYDTKKVNVNAVMSGNSKADLIIESGDIIVVSESLF